MNKTYIISGWWFGTFFIFPYIGKNYPNCLIVFRGVDTINHIYIFCVYIHICIYIYIYIVNVDMHPRHPKQVAMVLWIAMVFRVTSTSDISMALNGNFRILKWRYATIQGHIFVGIFPCLALKHMPYSLMYMYIYICIYIYIFIYTILYIYKCIYIYI